MLLICGRLLVTESKKEKNQCTREEHLHYLEIAKEVHSALMAGYELTLVSNDETNHSVTFMKYKADDKVILFLTVRGTEEEINDIQRIRL